MCPTKNASALKFERSVIAGPDELDLVVEVVGADGGAGVHQEYEVRLVPNTTFKGTLRQFCLNFTIDSANADT